MGKKSVLSPLVTSVSTTLKASITSDTQAVTPEEVIQKKKTMLGILDDALKLFQKNLADGKVEINSSLDLERIVKLTLLVAGEADSVQGKPINEKETMETISVDITKIDEILTLDDPNVKAIYDKITDGYNELNDID